MQWIEQYLTELHACSEESYCAFVQQFFTQLTVQVQNNVGANHVDLKLNSGEHDDVAVVQKALGCEVTAQKGKCTGRTAAVPAEDSPRTYREALVQTAPSPIDLVKTPAQFGHSKVNMVIPDVIPNAKNVVYKKKVKKLDYLKEMFQEIVDNCKDLAGLDYRMVYSTVRPKVETSVLSDVQLRNAWYRMFGSAIGKRSVRSSMPKMESPQLISANPYAVLSDQATGMASEFRSSREKEVEETDLQTKLLDDSANTELCLPVPKQDYGTCGEENQRHGCCQLAVRRARGMAPDNTVIAKRVEELFLKAGFIKGDSEHNRLALDLLLTDQALVEFLGCAIERKDKTKLEKCLRRQLVRWHSSASADSLSISADPLYCHDVENDGRLTGEKLTAKEQRQVCLEIFEEASQHFPSLPDLFVQVRRFCDTGVGFKRWTALLDRQLTERLSMHKSLDLDTAVYVKDLKSEGVFKTVQENTLKAKLRH